MQMRAVSRIGGNLEAGPVVRLRGNHHPLARAEFDAGPLDGNTRLDSLVMVLNPSEEQSAALDQLIQSQHDSTSPHYRQWLTPEEYAEHFGASREDVARIGGWLQSKGFSVDEVSRSRRSIRFSGTASQVEHAFATSMRRYRVAGKMHIANAVDPSIPAAMAPVVGGLLALHDFRSHSPRPSAEPRPEMSINGQYDFITPGDLATIYDVNALYTQGLSGSGEGIAIVARSNILLDDVRSFRSTYGLPANDPKVIVTNTDPGTSATEDFTEATLDAEYAGALAPNAAVTVVTSSSTIVSDGTLLSAQYIVNHNLAPVMSYSYALCETQIGATANSFINALWQQAAAQGITVLVAAGDTGAAGCDLGYTPSASLGRGVNGLCSTAYDTCVGGTEFNDFANPSQYWSSYNSTAQSSALGYIPETVWNESGAGLWAAGGGASNVYAKPAWQSGTGVPADGMRDVPDISLSSAQHDGYMFVLNGAQWIGGGTSFATPALAGFFALLAQRSGTRLGLVNPELYALADKAPAAFHDVVSGNNSVPGQAGYNAGVGYDLASGLGSIDAAVLVAQYGRASVASLQLKLAQSAVIAAPGGTAAAVRLTVASSGSAPVALSVGSLPKGFTASFAPAKITGSGGSSLQLSIASTVAAGTYAIKAVATNGRLSSSAPLTVTVNPPSFTLLSSKSTVALLPGISSATVAMSTTGTSGFNGSVALKAAGLPAGVTAAFSHATIAAPGTGSSTLTLVANGKAHSGSYVVVVTATAGSSSKSVQFTLNVPSLTDTLSAASLALRRGSGGSVVVSTKIAGGFNSAVSIAVKGLPAGITAKVSSIAAPGQGKAAITFAASSSAAIKSTTATVTLTGGGITSTLPLNITVTALAAHKFQ